MNASKDVQGGDIKKIKFVKLGTSTDDLGIIRHTGGYVIRKHIKTNRGNVLDGSSAHASGFIGDIMLYFPRCHLVSYSR